MSHPYYELTINVIGVINIVSIIIISSDMEKTSVAIEGKWITVQIIINLLFLIELISDLVVMTPLKAYKQHWRVWPETFCQFLNIIGMC